MAGLIAGAEIMFGGRTPHPYHTRPGMVSQSNDGDPHGKPPRRYRAGTVSALPQGPGTGSLSAPPLRPCRTGTWSRACTDQARREVKSRRSGWSSCCGCGYASSSAAWRPIRVAASAHASPSTSRSSPVAAQRVADGNLHQHDRDAIGILDPHLHQAPRLQHGLAHDAGSGRGQRPYSARTSRTCSQILTDAPGGPGARPETSSSPWPRKNTTAGSSAGPNSR